MLAAMDADRMFECEFCWPAQDRARACLPSTAPRKSPVFTASVFSSRAVRILNPLAATSPAAHRSLMHFASSIPGQLGGTRIEGDSTSCCDNGFLRRPSFPLTGNGGARPMPDWRIIGEQDQD